MARTESQALGGWRPWVVWAFGTLAFAATLFSRTSFGVAATAAAGRFGTQVTIMSVFVVVQMVVYAGMQLPAGLLLDRFGSRISLAAGMVIIGTAQLVLALTISLPLGVAVRMLIGAGDALIWMSAIRLIPTWFSPRHGPLLTQISSMSGQLGQWASAVPLVAILGRYGWTAAFLTVAGVCLLTGLLNLVFVRDAPPGVPPIRTGLGTGGLWAAVREVVAMPAAQLGYFMHMVTGFPALVFTLMWGFPYLTQAQARSPAETGALLTVMVIAGLVISPLVGILTRRFSGHRVGLGLAVAGYTAAVWIALLAWPGRAPGWLLIALMLAISADFPASNICFDINRDFVPARRLGTASGMAVAGGFSGALVTVLSIAVVLSVTGGGRPGPDAFRLAMAVQFPVWLFAVIMVMRARRKVMASEGLDRL